MENRNLQREVDSVTDDFLSLLSSLTQEVEEKEEIIEQLRETIESLEERIESLNEEIEELKNE